jgi:hypothetical protein
VGQDEDEEMSEQHPLSGKWFVLTTLGDGQGTTLHVGWKSICQAVVDVHYHEPTQEQRDEVMGRFTDFTDWEHLDGVPWRWVKSYEDGTVVVERVTSDPVNVMSVLIPVEAVLSLLAQARVDEHGSTEGVLEGLLTMFPSQRENYEQLLSAAQDKARRLQKD